MNLFFSQKKPFDLSSLTFKIYIMKKQNLKKFKLNKTNVSNVTGSIHGGAQKNSSSYFYRNN